MLQAIQETTVVAFAVSFAETKTMSNYWNELKACFWWENCSISLIINCLEQERDQSLSEIERELDATEDKQLKPSA